jgi:uncharacterized protein YacL
MAKKPEPQLRIQDIPVISTKSAMHFGVIVVFALIGAGILGSIAQPVVLWLFLVIGRLISGNPPDTSNFHIIPFATALPFSLLGIILGSYLGMRFLRSLEKVGIRWDKMDAGDKVTLFIGIFAGLIASVPLLLMFQALDMPPLYRAVLISAVMVGFGAVSVYALQSMAELLPWNRNRGPKKRSGIKLVDTNVIIDGRIYDVMKTGFIDGQLYVPGFVLDELQYIADSHDSLRRQRGRRGLEVLRHMQSDFELDTRTQDRLASDQGDGVDARLVRLAKALGADIVTNDFNLRRVAEVQSVRVLSLNDLALALRSNVLPQETLELMIIREGNQIGQGIGYLEDGTMVVVENGKPHIGETVEVTVTQVHQTERGKMIFGEVEGEEEVRYERRRPTRPRTSA